MIITNIQIILYWFICILTGCIIAELIKRKTST